MTSSPSNNFEELTTDQKCDYLFSALQNIRNGEDEHKNDMDLGRLKIVELRLKLLEEVVAENYPTIEELQRLLAVPHGVWAAIIANSADCYRIGFA